MHQTSFTLFLDLQHLFPNHNIFVTNLTTISILKTLSKALGDKNWKVAIKMEMDALEKNKTLELVKMLSGKIKKQWCRWVFTVNYKSMAH